MNALTFIPLVEQLSSRVVRILGCNANTYTLQGTNTYLVGTGSKRILIDASGATDNITDYVELLKKELLACNCSLQEILITHWHPDHTGGVQPIFKGLLNGSTCKVSKHVLDNRSEPDEVTKFTFITENDVIRTEGATLKPIFTPGHARDHLCFYFEEENSLFSGDLILGETSAKFEDLYDYMKSLHKVKTLNADHIYPGHGPLIKEGGVRIQHYIDHRNKRNEQILEFLNKIEGTTEVEEIVRGVYEGLSDALFTAACENVSGHLSWLFKEGKVGKKSFKVEIKYEFYFLFFLLQIEQDGDKWLIKKSE